MNWFVRVSFHVQPRLVIIQVLNLHSMFMFDPTRRSHSLNSLTLMIHKSKNEIILNDYAPRSVNDQPDHNHVGTYGLYHKFMIVSASRNPPHHDPNMHLWSFVSIFVLFRFHFAMIALTCGWRSIIINVIMIHHWSFANVLKINHFYLTDSNHYARILIILAHEHSLASFVWAGFLVYRSLMMLMPMLMPMMFMILFVFVPPGPSIIFVIFVMLI